MVVRYPMRRMGLWAVLACVSIGVLYLLLSYFLSAITCVWSYELQSDPLFSQGVHAVLRRALEQVPVGAALSQYHACINALCVQYTSIAGFTSALVVPHKAIIQFYARRPCILVNTTYCITRQGDAYACSDINSTVWETVPCITVHDYVHDNRLVNQQLVAWIEALPEGVVQDYVITWHSTTMRTLQPKKATAPYTIVCADTPLTSSLLAACIAAIRQQQEQTAGFFAWTADVRFAHQIIIKKERIRTSVGVENHA